MDNRTMAPLGQTVVDVKFTKFYKRVQRYPSVSIDPWDRH